MGNTLFELRQSGKTSLCLAEDFGEMIELLTLLNKVRGAKETTPTLREAEWLMRHLDKAHGLRPLCTSPKLALLKPIPAETFAEALEEFQQSPCETRHVVLDYDNDRFAFSEWEDGGISEISGTLSGVIHAYSSSVRRLNASQFYINEQAFADGMTAVCDTKNTLKMSFCPTPFQTQC